MPKVKTRTAAKKRFKVTGSGKIMRRPATEPQPGSEVVEA